MRRFHKNFLSFHCKNYLGLIQILKSNKKEHYGKLKTEGYIFNLLNSDLAFLFRPK